MHLVNDKAFHGVGDSHTVDQQDRVNRKEIEQGDKVPCFGAEMLFHHFSNIFTRIFTGKQLRVTF